MIPKVFNSPPAGFPALAPRGGTGGESPRGFQALLEGELAAARPLETRILSFLIEMIEKMMEVPDRGPLPGPGGPLGLEWESYPPAPIAAAPIREDPDLGARPQKSGEGQDIDRLIQEAAVKYDMDADLIRSVIQVESNFNPQAVSPAGAQGMMQLMPGTAADLGVRNPFDPGQNIDGGTRYLRRLLERYGGNRRLALAAYNWGMGNLEKRPEALPQETRRYLMKVEKAYQRYAGASPTQAADRA